MNVPSVGAKLISERTITASDIEVCARITGDYGAHHVAGLAGRQMAQGLLGAAATPVLGEPRLWLSQMSLQFMAPVFAGDTIRAGAEVTGVRPDDAGGVALEFSIQIDNTDGVTVMRGQGSGSLPAEALTPGGTDDR
jgi:acyl dehydratase